MVNPIIFPSNIQWAGLVKETTYGTPATPPTAWIPIDTPVHTPNVMMLTDTALRGNMAYAQAQVAGVISHDFTYVTNLYMDTCFYHFQGILGYPDSVTGTVDPYTHKTALLDTSDGQPPSYTMYLFNGAETWQLAGSKATQLDIDIKPDGLITLTPTWKAASAVKVSNPANTPSTALPVPGWNTSVTVASVGTSVYSAAKISLKRNDANPIWTLSGSQTPYEIFLGSLVAEGELTQVYQGYTGAPTDLTDYLTNVQPALTIQSNPAGDATHYLKLQLSTVGYTASNVSAQNGYMSLNSKIQGIKNATDGLGATVSPILATVQNTASTSY